MKLCLKTSAAILLAGGTLLAAATASAGGCSPILIRLGLIDIPECKLDPSDLKTGYDRYLARKAGLLKYIDKSTAEPQAELHVYQLFARPQSGAMNVDFWIENSGTAGTGYFDARTTVEFQRVDGAGVTVQPPVTVPVSPLRAGDTIGMSIDLVSLVQIPDTRYTYDVVVTTKADSGNAVAEQDETNNSKTGVCRYIGTDPSQLFYPPAGVPMCGVDYL